MLHTNASGAGLLPCDSKSELAHFREVGIIVGLERQAGSDGVVTGLSDVLWLVAG